MRNIRAGDVVPTDRTPSVVAGIPHSSLLLLLQARKASNASSKRIIDLESPMTPRPIAVLRLLNLHVHHRCYCRRLRGSYVCDIRAGDVTPASRTPDEATVRRVVRSI